MGKYPHTTYRGIIGFGNFVLSLFYLRIIRKKIRVGLGKKSGNEMGNSVFFYFLVLRFKLFTTFVVKSK
jgi:hypothetical protein